MMQDHLSRARSVFVALSATIALACGDTTSPVRAPDGAVTPAAGSLAVTSVSTVTIFPSRDRSGATDAAAVQSALNAAGPGDVVALAQGTFFINRTIVAPVGFHGTLRGAGKDRTKIVGVGRRSAPFGNTLITHPGSVNVVTGSSFLLFPQPSGSVTVSDLAASLPKGFVTQPSDEGPGSTDLIAFFIVQLGSANCNTLFDGVRLQGTETNFSDAPAFLVHQPLWGIAVMGVADAFPFFSSSGSHVVRNSEFSKVGIEATAHQFFKGATIAITNNVFTELKQVIVRWLDGADIAITDNTMRTFSFGAVVVTQEANDIPGERSNVVISGNDITNDGFLGIEIGNLGSPFLKPDFNVTIVNNHITKGDDPTGLAFNFAGIQIATGERRAVVRNNRIEGHAAFGVFVDHVHNSLFAGNDLTGFAPVEAHYALIDSNNNKVVLQGDETVLDLGTGNTIIRGGRFP